MFEFLVIVVFGWLLFRSVGLVFGLTWGIAKILVSLLIGLTVPVLFICLIFVGGIALLVPLGMLAVVVAIVKAFVN